jgi:hypothetical protein
LEKRAEQVQPGSEVGGGEKDGAQNRFSLEARWVGERKMGQGTGGEMAQTMYLNI